MVSTAQVASILLGQFDALDADGDGLSFSEAQSGYHALAMSTFGALDVNSDGRLSAAELGAREEPPSGDGETILAEPNAYAWDGSWAPEAAVLPPAGLYDDRYFDGHEVGGAPSPILPPGDWDYIDPHTGQVSLLAVYRDFARNVGALHLLVDAEMNPFGWRIEGRDPDATQLTGPAGSFHGSSGTDVADTGPWGQLRSGSFRMGEGPDILRFAVSSASDVRTGSDLDGGERDNDLVIGGDDIIRTVGDPAVRGMTVHTGPGSDLVFINNMEQAAVDLGNGADGRTDTLDPGDGDDFVVIGGNFRDCRVYGGGGDDIFVWYIDETGPTTRLLANSFFGAGGWLPAVWEDTGIDRLVLIVPDETVVFSGLGTVGEGQVQLGIRPGFPDLPVPDVPTADDVFARYYGIAGRNPADNRQTVFMDYRSASGHVHAGDIYLTAIEELQIGIGPEATVYRVDDVTGSAIVDPTLVPIREIPSREAYHAIIDDFAAQ